MGSESSFLDDLWVPHFCRQGHYVDSSGFNSSALAST